MQPDRGGMAAAADDPDHLPPWPALAARDQLGEQRAPDPGAVPGRLDIDRILDREPIGRSAYSQSNPVKLGIDAAEFKEGRKLEVGGQGRRPSRPSQYPWTEAARRTFQRELHRPQGRIGSAYDTNITAYDPYPSSPNSHYSDPVLDDTRAPITSAMTDLYQHVLNWRVDRPYELLNREISREWGWGRGRVPPQVVEDLRQDLASDPLVRVLVVHGANDLVTPYFGTQLLLDQLPAYGSADRLKLAVYAGGHMFYLDDASRASLREEAAWMFG